jgi:hypothetical protein
MGRRVCLNATGVLQACNLQRPCVGVAMSPGETSGQGPRGRHPDEESGKAVEDARRAEVGNTRSQRGKKMGR